MTERGELHCGAVKIFSPQYPGVAKSIDSDVNNIMTALSLSNALPEGKIVGGFCLLPFFYIFYRFYDNSCHCLIIVIILTVNILAYTSSPHVMISSF